MFKAIREYNNWGYIEYRMGGKDWDGQDITKQLNAKKTVRVMFPDGKTVKELPLKSKHYSEHVNDMGHESTANSVKLFAVFKLWGADAYIPIESLKVDL